MTSESAAAKELREKILAERAKGNIVFRALDSLMVANLEEFIQQPADGILYDLNRLEEISLTFLDDRKWVNDFAVALVIRKLKEKLERTQLSSAAEHSSHNRLAPTRERMGSQANGATDGGTGGATPSNATNAGSIPAGPASSGEPEKAREGK